MAVDDYFPTQFIVQILFLTTNSGKYNNKILSWVRGVFSKGAMGALAPAILKNRLLFSNRNFWTF